MKVTIEKKTLITLILMEDEVKWLRGICQNPMWVDDPDKEDPLDKQMRMAFWNALKEK